MFILSHPLAHPAYFIALLLEGYRIAMIVDGHQEKYFIVDPAEPLIPTDIALAIGIVMSSLEVLTSIIANKYSYS